MLIINNFLNICINILSPVFNFFVSITLTFSFKIVNTLSKVIESFFIWEGSQFWISMLFLIFFFILTLLITNNSSTKINFKWNIILGLFFIYYLLKEFSLFIKISLINSISSLNSTDSTVYLNKTTNFLIENLNSENFILNHIFWFLILSFFIWFLIANNTSKVSNFNWIIIIFFFTISSFFINQIQSLFIFYTIIECNSIFFFILLFNNKNIGNNSLLKFYGVIFNVVGSIFMLAALGIFYINTGSFYCNIELINSIFSAADQNFWLVGFYLCFFIFILFKIGFFLIFPIYINFYNIISIESIMYSVILLKTLILWFFMQNYYFFYLINKILENSYPEFISSLFWIFSISILIGVYFFKFFSKMNSNLILYISNYISGLIIFFVLLFSNILFNVALYTTLIYYFISTLIIFLVLNVSSYREFILVMLFYLGFPGILFFIKLNLFSVLLISKTNFIGLLLVISVIFMLFIQEFFFSSKKFNYLVTINDNNLAINSNSKFIILFSFITILSLVF
jgi:hypothetical protein